MWKYIVVFIFVILLICIYIAYRIDAFVGIIESMKNLAYEERRKLATEARKNYDFIDYWIEGMLSRGGY